MSQQSDDELVSKVKEIIGYEFKDPAILKIARTHTSRSSEHKEEPDYQMLAYLGDAVLQLIVIEELCKQKGLKWDKDNDPEKQKQVRKEALSDITSKTGLLEILILGTGAAKQHHETSPKPKAELIEAIMGAVFLDGKENGYEQARKVYHTLRGKNQVSRQHF